MLGAPGNDLTGDVNVLDVAALTDDVPARGLRRGQIGTVVDVLEPDVFEVEFSDDDGVMYAMVPLGARDLIALHYEPAR